MPNFARQIEMVASDRQNRKITAGEPVTSSSPPPSSPFSRRVFQRHRPGPVLSGESPVVGDQPAAAGHLETFDSCIG
jgi:hypothetical protein